MFVRMSLHSLGHSFTAVDGAEPLGTERKCRMTVFVARQAGSCRSRLSNRSTRLEGKRTRNFRRRPRANWTRITIGAKHLKLRRRTGCGRAALVDYAARCNLRWTTATRRLAPVVAFLHDREPNYFRSGGARDVPHASFSNSGLKQDFSLSAAREAERYFFEGLRCRE